MSLEGKNATEEETLLIEINQEGFCAWANHSLTALTGYRLEEVVGKKFKDFLVIDSDRLRDIEQKISVQEDNIISFEADFRQKNGKKLLMTWFLNWSEQQNVLQCFGKKVSGSNQKYLKENKELRLLNTLNECIRKNKEPEEIFDGLCKIVAKDGNYPMVWIAKVNPTHLEVWYRESEVYIAQNEFRKSGLLDYVFKNYIENQAQLERCVLDLPPTQASTWFAEGKPNLAKLMLSPLWLEENSIWLFAVATSDPNGFDAHERAILNEVTNNVEAALRQIQIEAKTISTESSLNKYIQELNLLNEVNNQILIQTNETELITNVLEILVQKGSYKLAWVLFFEKDKERNHVHSPRYFAGEIDYAKDLRFDLSDPQILKGPTATSILTRKTIILGSSQEDPDFIVWKEKAKKHGLQSSVCLYLDIEGGEKGILAVYSSKKNMFDNKEVIILERIGHNLAFALSQMRTNKLKAEYRTELNLAKQKIHDFEIAIDKTMLVCKVNTAGIITHNNHNFLNYFYKDGSKAIGKMHPLLIENGKQNGLWSRLVQSMHEGENHFEEIVPCMVGTDLIPFKLLVFPNKSNEQIIFEYLIVCLPLHGAQIIEKKEIESVSLNEQQKEFLKELKQITSLEISHELHKLQSIVELAQDLDVVDNDLVEIFSSSKEVFHKTDLAVRKLADKINKQLAESASMAGTKGKYQQIIVIEDDHLSSKICLKLLNKYYEKNQLYSFSNLTDALAYLSQTEDKGDNLFLLSAHLKEDGVREFLHHYESKSMKSPLLLLSNNPESDKHSAHARHKAVKNIIEKPLNVHLAEAIYTGDLIHQTSGN